MSRAVFAICTRNLDTNDLVRKKTLYEMVMNDLFEVHFVSSRLALLVDQKKLIDQTENVQIRSLNMKKLYAYRMSSQPNPTHKFNFPMKQSHFFEARSVLCVIQCN